LTGILIVDDEMVIRAALRRLLERNGYEVVEAESAEAAIELIRPGELGMILSDLRLPGAPGTEIITAAGDIPVVIMTSYASVNSAVEAMKLGAVDYIAKPFDHDELLMLIERTLEKRQLVKTNAVLRSTVDQSYPVTGMVGECPAMREVSDRIQRVAPTDATVLITGESGTGKELVARAVHEQSRRRQAAIVPVNCAAIPEGLIESELFGHERGAFTGATGRREGLIEAADGGTLFLDEIGELPLAAQGRLLRVLQEGEIRPVGSSRARRVDIRLIAATHRPLRQMVEEGAFREDLFFRLNVLQIPLPPLRERGDDIVILARFLLDKACRRLNRPAASFNEQAMAAIRSCQWPGNVRELENTIERAVILGDDGEIDADALGLEGVAEDVPDEGESLDDYFRRFVTTHQGRLTETELARRLGISRKTLWERRQRLGVPRQGREANS
jgi:DNA-binding NtrC family response regulator